jgi:gentisate 1,2-dioxygenase
VSPIEFADRQQFLLVNPGLGGRLQVASTIRCAVSIYNPGDVAPVHMHTPNASRTILSENGGYTTIEGERCVAARGDLILTPNGTWHDHGNDGATPVVWADILDFPLLEFLDCSWIDEKFPGEREGNACAQRAMFGDRHSERLYGAGGILPGFVSHRRGIGHDTSPVFDYRGRDIRAALEGLRGEAGDPYEGITLRFVNPATGASVFPTLDYGAQLLLPGGSARPPMPSTSCSTARARPRSPAGNSTGRRTTCLSRRISCGDGTSTAARRTRCFISAPTGRCSRRSANTARRAALPTARSRSSSAS